MPIASTPMAAMKPNDHPDEPPSYSESVHSDAKSSRVPEYQGPSIDMVDSLLENDIFPHIQSSISSGVSSTTLIFVPSNVSSLRAPAEADSKAPPKGFQGEKLVGFPSTEEVTLIRLADPEDTLEFWQRPASKQKLAKGLHMRLVQQGYYFQEDVAKAESFEMLTGVPSNSRAGWMTANEERLRRREASINVSVQEVCLRVEDDMGLFETRKGRALAVRLKIGCEDTPSVWG